MNFAFTAEEEAFRAEVRDFLREALPPDWGVRNAGDDEEGGGDGYDFQWDFNRKLAEKGWLVVAWPKEYGGQEWSYFKQVVYAEEVVKHQAPRGDSIGPRMVGSLLIGHGTEAQKEALPAPHREGRRALVPALQRTQRGLRPPPASRPSPKTTATTSS